MSSSLDVIEQSARAAIPYTLDTSGFGGTPTDESVLVTDLLSGDDVSDDVLSGSATVASDTITTPKVQDLTSGRFYRLHILFTAGGADWAPSWIVRCVP